MMAKFPSTRIAATCSKKAGTVSLIPVEKSKRFVFLYSFSDKKGVQQTNRGLERKGSGDRKLFFIVTEQGGRKLFFIVTEQGGRMFHPTPRHLCAVKFSFNTGLCSIR
jgi:hypothetical protein